MSVSYKSILNIYCQKQSVAFPIFNTIELKNGYKTTTTFYGETFEFFNILKKKSIEGCAKQILIKFNINIDKMVDYKGLVISHCKQKKIPEPSYIFRGFTNGDYHVFSDYNGKQYIAHHENLLNAEKICAKQIYQDIQNYSIIMFIFITNTTTYENIHFMNDYISNISNPDEYKLIIISKNPFPASCLGDKGAQFHSIEFQSENIVYKLSDVNIEYIIH